MTPTIRADMTDQKTQMREGFEAQRKAGMNVDWFTWQIAWHDALFTVHDLVGDATGRQPAAIDRQEAAVTREEVEQDERGAISEHDAKGLEIIASWMDRDGLIEPAEFLRNLAARAASTSANVAQDERGATDRYQVLNEAGEALLAADHCDAYEVIYRMMKDARAASTSANVAQLDMSLEARLTDAEADVKRLHAEKMELWNQVHGYSANVAQGSEAVAWFTDDSQSDKSATTWDRNVAERWRTKGWPVSPLYAAPPAQTALTDAKLLSHIRRDIRIELARAEAELNVEGVQAFRRALNAIDAALTAAQSASGDTNG